MLISADELRKKHFENIYSTEYFVEYMKTLNNKLKNTTILDSFIDIEVPIKSYYNVVFEYIISLGYTIHCRTLYGDYCPKLMSDKVDIWEVYW